MQMSWSQPGPEFPGAHVTHVKLSTDRHWSSYTDVSHGGGVQRETARCLSIAPLRPITTYAGPCHQQMDASSCLCHLLHCISLEKVKLKIKHRFSASSLKNAQHFRSLAQSVQN